MAHDPERLTVWKVVSEWNREEGPRRVLSIVSAEVVKTPTRLRFADDSGRRTFGYHAFLELRDADFTPEAAIARFRRGLESTRDRAYEQARTAERELDALLEVEVDYLDSKGGHRG